MKTYIIPDNYIDDGRIIRGMFRTRYFIEAVLLALIGLMFLLPLEIRSVTTKITIYVCVCAPLFILGVIGVGGNPISIAITNVITWLRMRSIMLYDNNPRALVATPVEKMMKSTVKRDEIIAFVDRWKTDRQVQRLQQQLVEGETFRFNEDQDRMREYVPTDDENQNTYVMSKKTNKFSVSKSQIKKGSKVTDIVFDLGDELYPETPNSSVYFDVEDDGDKAVLQHEKRSLHDYTSYEFDAGDSFIVDHNS